jgi:hypothetical protein
MSWEGAETYAVLWAHSFCDAAAVRQALMLGIPLDAHAAVGMLAAVGFTLEEMTLPLWYGGTLHANRQPAYVQVAGHATAAELFNRLIQYRRKLRDQQ